MTYPAKALSKLKQQSGMAIIQSQLRRCLCLLHTLSSGRQPKAATECTLKEACRSVAKRGTPREEDKLICKWHTSLDRRSSVTLSIPGLGRSSSYNRATGIRSTNLASTCEYNTTLSKATHPCTSRILLNDSTIMKSKPVLCAIPLSVFYTFHLRHLQIASEGNIRAYLHPQRARNFILAILTQQIRKVGSSQPIGFLPRWTRRPEHDAQTNTQQTRELVICGRSRQSYRHIRCLGHLQVR